jgi:dihydropyrimidine dehydrogenase (NAD+) subunit PreA
MHYGFRLIEELTDGLSHWLDEKGARSVREVVGAAAPRYSPFNELDLSYKVVARIDEALCIHCNLCYAACDEGAHQCIDLTAKGVKIDPKTYTGSAKTQPVVREEDCVGCNLCSLVCPVDGCITMVEVDSGREPVTWGEITRERPEVTLQWDEMRRYRAEKGIEIH